MATSFIRPSFAAGEISPSLWGRTDLAKFHVGCATLRNCFVNYRGGGSSRAGSRFVGMCKQPGTAAPPRDISFRFSLSQTYTLEFGDQYMRVVANGGYVLEASFAITGATNANPCQITVPGHNFVAGDWIFLAGIAGMVNLNGVTAIVRSVAGNVVTLNDIFGAALNSLTFPAYTGGGTAARIFTLVTPYAAVDLPYLKFTQSANVMTLTLSNPVTGTEYPQQTLTRIAANNWTIAAETYGSSIAAPGAPTVVANVTTATNPVTYAYVVTAVDATTGNESVASPVGSANNSVDISITAGSLTITWPSVTGAAFYNVYKAPAGVNAGVPIGSSFGFLGSSFGTQFVDDNIIADFTTTPPLHLNPFARGQLIGVTKTHAQTSPYTQATTTAVMVSATGSGAVLQPVVVSGDVVAIIIQNPGQNYRVGDTLLITDSSGGVGATFTPTIGPQSGTFPGVVAYFQQRRVYGDSFNNPDTGWMSQPGSYTLFDAASPPIASDAITFTPWAQQVNGIQWLVSMPGGLLVLTGMDTWLVAGDSGANSPVSPGQVSAQPQESYGSSPILPPIKVNYHLLYGQSLGWGVRDIAYNFFANIYAGDDLTQYANHLFEGHTLQQWAWAREPYKLIWAVREDGVMLSLTYLKEQEVVGWGRHDTNGLYVSVSSAAEPPVDAVYCIVQRYVPGRGVYAYYQERMDNRIWSNAEATWCADCALALPLPAPNATLSAAAATGANVAFTASAAVFDGATTGVPGQVIRTGGGKATVTQFVSPTQVLATVTVPIAKTFPSDPNQRPVPQVAGNWTIATPAQTVTGLTHLEGFQVAILADGNVLPRQTVVNGTIVLPVAATQVLVGLPFQPQLQTLHQDIPGGPTIQGKRRKTNAVTFRIEKSRGVKVGTNQPNASAQEFGVDVPWGQDTQQVGKLVEQRQTFANLGPNQYLPLVTGDARELVDGDWDLTGMIAFQQDNPLPMNILASIPEMSIGDANM